MHSQEMLVSQNESAIGKMGMMLLFLLVTKVMLQFTDDERDVAAG
jgi:hypothetical protein